MNRTSTAFSQFLNPCIGKILCDPAFRFEHMNECESEYFQAEILENHFKFLELPLPGMQSNSQALQ